MIKVEDKEKCCGCQACAAVCSRIAINMIEDEYGNTFPVVNESVCSNCNLCERVCPIENDNNFHKSRCSYVVSLKRKEILRNSASGGAFWGIAASFIKNTNGFVYGCIYDRQMRPVFYGTNELLELELFQGSKYVMSTIDREIYREIKNHLINGEKVLFSGVPCQCSAVRMYCDGYQDGLFTLELLCHGFTNQHYFLDYIKVLNRKVKGSVVDFRFRSKDKSSFVARYVASLPTHDGGIRYKTFHTNPATSYYYDNFLSGKIYRENCYVCKYAKGERASDITIGDCWGYTGRLDTRNGVSAVLCNTKKGDELFSLSKEYFYEEKIDFSMIALNNEQLRQPVSIKKKDYSILTEWKLKGAEFQNSNHEKRHFKAFLFSKIGLFR